MSALKRALPGAIGISFGSANRLLGRLEAPDTEVHALLVARGGWVGLEGYWAPYGPGQPHGSQSLTKTMTGVALGAAMQEGLIGLDERLVDVFPEYARHAAGRRWWDALRVRHIASMAAGMDAQPSVTSPDWLEDFFRMEIAHAPGTAFFYNSIACSTVGACVRKRSGQGLMDFLKPRVFDVVGIDAGHLLWHRHPDGLENGSGGLVSTARDNALMMELYRRGGVWDGRRILSREWVDFALRVQNPHTGRPAKYGGMLWVRDGFVMADGAMGQWAMLFPGKDLVISINQTLDGDAFERVLGALESFAAGLSDAPVEWTAEEIAAFENRLARLCIPAPRCREDRPALEALSGRALRVVSGEAQFFADDLAIFDRAYTAPVRRFGFEAADGNLRLHVCADGGEVVCPVSMKGSRPVCTLDPVSPNPARTASVTGAFEKDGALALEVRWLESCRVHNVTFRFDEEGADIVTERVPVGGFDVPPLYARAVWER